MDSKLPVLIKKPRNGKNNQKCMCSKFFELMMGNCEFCEIKKAKLGKSRSSQTKFPDCIFEKELIQCAEIQKMLSAINETLATILTALKEKPENNQETTRKSSRHLGIQKAEKFKKKNNILLIKRHAYGWPDITRFYAHPPWVNHYMQKFFFMAQENLVSRNLNMLCSMRPLSCPNFNHMPPFDGFGDRSCCVAVPIPICSTRLFPINEQGDLHVKALQCKPITGSVLTIEIEEEKSEHKMTELMSAVKE